MDNTSSFNNNIDTLFSDLHNFVTTDTVLGSPVTVENKTLVPLMSVTLGYGSTGMGGKTSMGNGGASTTTGGVGLGAKVSASGLVVIDKAKDTVQVIPANGASSMSQLMDKIPQAISNIGQSMMGQGQNQSQGQNQGQSQGQQQQGSSQGQQSGPQNSSSTQQGSGSSGSKNMC